MRYLLPQLLEHSAETQADRPAVIDGPVHLTYRELESQANRLAHLLHSLGVGPGDRVGLYLDKSAEAVVGAYGIMKSGAAYVPLDPGAPLARLSRIVADCGLTALVTGDEKSAQWAGLLEAATSIKAMVVLNADSPIQFPHVTVVGQSALHGLPESPPPITTIDQDLAYILYTSGSTGVPKGVMLTHRNALAFVEWAVQEFGVGPEDRLSSHAPFHFDLSIFDLYAASWAGASVVLVPPKASLFPGEIVRFIQKQQISVWYSVPSVLTMVALRGGLASNAPPSLRLVLFAGEVFSTKHLRKLMSLLPGVRFANLYGPTETNVCTWYEVSELPDDDETTIPIGRAIPNDDVVAVLDDRTRAAVGEIGELLVRGATVMKGYWGDPERTAERLIPDPLGSGDAVYMTGDLAEQLADGGFRLVGRRDAQVKSRGYRIELGDVEAALQAHPAIVECAVVAIPDEVFTNRLVAYVVESDPVNEADLIAFMSDHLPAYMVPESFEPLSALPRTSTGKIDRQELSSVQGSG